jgi:hypothetical protein
MEIWTVAYMQENDYMPFYFAYKSHDAAKKAVDETAKQEYEEYRSEDDPPWEGLDWSDDNTTAFVDQDDTDAGYYVIQRTNLVEE